MIIINLVVKALKFFYKWISNHSNYTTKAEDKSDKIIQDHAKINWDVIFKFYLN